MPTFLYFLVPPIGLLVIVGIAWFIERSRREAAHALARQEDANRIALLEAEARQREERLKERTSEAEEARTLRTQHLELSRLEAELRAQVESGAMALATQTESHRALVAEMKIRLEAAETANAEAVEALDLASADARRLAAREAELKAQVEAGTAALAQAERTAGSMTDELRQQIEALKTEQSATETELRNVRDEAANLAAREAELKAQVEASVGTLAQEQASATAMNLELRQQIEALRTEQSATEEELRRVREEASGLAAREAELKASLEARETAFEEARQRLEERFQALAGQTLQSNSEAFLQLARTTLESTQALAKSDLEAKQVAIAGLLEPLRTGMAAMDQQVRSFQEARTASEAQLANQLQALAESQKGLQGETGRLANALRKPQVRGRWGELQLQNLVELAGMQEHVDFLTQVSVKVDEDRRRPDMLVKMPGGKCVAVDAKTPLGAYLDALEAASEEEKQAQLAKLPDLIRQHVAQLADKRYYEGLAQSPDFVVLFLHGEGPFALACEKDPNLLQDALRQNVLLATPVTLIALLKSAAFGWQQQRIQDNAEEIRATAAELIKRFAVMTEHIEAIGDGLSKAVGSYNAFAGSMEGRVVPQARRIQALGVQAYGKKGEQIKLPALKPLHQQTRACDLRTLSTFQDIDGLPAEAEADINASTDADADLENGTEA